MPTPAFHDSHNDFNQVIGRNGPDVNITRYRLNGDFEWDYDIVSSSPIALTVDETAVAKEPDKTGRRSERKWLQL